MISQGSTGSVGVGSRSGMLKVAGSIHMWVKEPCVKPQMLLYLFSWGGGGGCPIYLGREEISHNFLEYVKFPTNHKFHRNFPISTWENFNGNLTCMLEWNCYLTRIHVNQSFHLRQCSPPAIMRLISRPFNPLSLSLGPRVFAAYMVNAKRFPPNNDVKP